MQGSKIRLSPPEAALICNADVILTKNSIIQKTVALFAAVQDEIQHENRVLHLSTTPKISKGENYLGLPYVVLDYPRISKGDDIFFIRTMFWWGNFFSSTLQLGGRYKVNNIASISSAYHTLSAHDYYIGVSNDAWQHHFEASNYQKITTLAQQDFTSLLQQQPHTKIAARWPLSEWDAAANSLLNSWRLLANLIS